MVEETYLNPPKLHFCIPNPNKGRRYNLILMSKFVHTVLLQNTVGGMAIYTSETIALGIWDAGLSERLQMDKNVNQQRCQQDTTSKAVEQQQTTGRGKSELDNGSIGAIKVPKCDKQKPWKSKAG